MLGRDLIIYILENGLENEPLFKDGRLLGFMTEAEAAIKFDVRTSTIQVWVGMGHLEGVKIGNMLYIPANADDPRKKNTIK